MRSEDCRTDELKDCGLKRLSNCQTVELNCRTIMKTCPEILDTKRLEREGTSRTGRMMAALRTDFVRVNEHGPADWMVFAKRYAAHLRFFDLGNSDAGDWTSFFTHDPSVLLAVAAVQRVDFYKQNLQAHLKYLLDSDHDGNGAELKKHFGQIFNILGTLATQLDFLQAALPEEIGLKATLQNLIRSQLAEPFQRLKLHYAEAVTEGLIDLAPLPSWSILGSDIVSFQDTDARVFSEFWDSSTTAANFDGAAIFGSLLPAPPIPVFEPLNFAAGHNLFTDILDQFLKVYARTVSEASSGLEKTLVTLDSHQPHYALFLAFLRLLEFARDHANTLTERHLDFYYKEVLKLKKRPAEPNHAHLVFELAKHRDSHLLKAGTLFKAGKDSEGNPVSFRLDEDFVANRAQVAKLRSIHHEGRLFAYPVANSKDGKGEELDSVDGQWDAFSGPETGEDLGKTGFAIASHFLFLKEGERHIRLRLHIREFPKKDMALLAFCQAFDFYLTGEKGWVKAKLDEGKIAPGGINQNIAIPLKLNGGQPPIVPLDAKVHGEDLPAGLPVLKAVLRQDGGQKTSLENIQGMAFLPNKSSLDVAVGYDGFGSLKPNNEGLKDLFLSSKLGTLKADKPFLPFGPLPEKGDFLIVGSDEAMQKAGAKIQFKIRWKGLPKWRGDLDLDWVNEFTPRIQLSALTNGAWTDAGATDNDGYAGLQVFHEGIFPEAEKYFPPKPHALLTDAHAEPHFDARPYGVSSRNGFFRLELLGDFGHKLYQLTLPRYLMRVALKEPLETDRGKLRDLVYNKVGPNQYEPKNKFTFTEDFVEHFSKAMPIEPYTPEVESLTMSYQASVGLADEGAKFYQITPFGHCPVSVLPIREESFGPANVNLFKGWPQKGELLIGLTGLKPPQNLSLLFQVAEGSANPEILKPENHVKWSYLSGNGWVDFSHLEISDRTGQLTRSGIVTFSIPKGATADDSRFLPQGCHWIRMSVSEKLDAICKIIQISAQAARATFEDQSNADDFLASQMPAGSIAKMVVPQAAVKKTIQPYATFGGRQEETSGHFYVRVSERLRHKQRAITAWDYEHLVLEASPPIFKIKCLNHTRYEPAETGKKRIYNELAPGHVTLIAIPDLTNRNAINPLRPYTNLGLLEEVRDFLGKQVSCFVKLHVHNPIYEAVRVKFNVKFYPGTDETFHRKLLQNTIVRHLAPWAFGDSREFTFGGKIYKSALIDLVEEQAYVDYVTEFQLFPAGSTEDHEEVRASVAIAVLVPEVAEKQEVNVIAVGDEVVVDGMCEC